MYSYSCVYIPLAQNCTCRGAHRREVRHARRQSKQRARPKRSGQSWERTTCASARARLQTGEGRAPAGGRTEEKCATQDDSPNRERDPSGVDWQMENADDVRYKLPRSTKQVICTNCSKCFSSQKTPRFVTSATNHPLRVSGMLPRWRGRIPQMRLQRGSVAV